MLFIPSLLGLCFCVWLARGFQFSLRMSSFSIIFVLTAFSLNLLTLDLRKIGDKYIAYGEKSLTPIEVATAYVAVAGMAGGGIFVGAPYAALENFLLLFPNDGHVTLDDDFPASSSKIQRLIETAYQAKTLSTKFPLFWDTYCQDTCDHGFALNGGVLFVNRTATACQASVSVSVSYKPQYRGSTLISSRFLILRVDQAALSALQKLGYLYPYEISYRWFC